MQEHLFFPAPSSERYVCYPDFVGGYSDRPEHAVDRPARSDDLQLNRLYNLHLVLGGRGTVRCGSRSFQLREGEGFLYGPATEQRYAADRNDPWNIRWVHFSCAAADRLLGSRGLGEPWLFRLKDLSLVSACMERLLQLGRGFDPGREAEASALLYELLLRLAADATPLAESRDPSVPGILAAADYIRGRCTDQALSLAEVAALAGYSVPYFSRKFHQLMNRTPSAYLLEARVLHAKQLLVSTTLTVREIAAASGFSQSSYFIQCFRKVEQMTPEQFRVSRRT
ncbi:AraC family transcriptional regulator [Saccharibacillus sp. O23]|uniref:AraC family transcriptional regulator n=1 Tax=Saccharibacillus sp. O23 TaxID=2009338 RepID=UPI000B4E1C27|nr:AraC family transcriptional regulator [Saccharibacillus sp. O23]OWR32996.1 AraC family transcriptional regulator [Saccharibacillus sp. O23]